MRTADRRRLSRRSERHRVEEPPRAWSPPPPQPASTGLAARTRAPIHLAATATGAPTRSTAPPAPPPPAPPEPEPVAQAPPSGSLRPPRESGYPRAHRAATGCRLRLSCLTSPTSPRCPIRRLSRRARTGPPANTSAGDGHPSSPMQSPLGRSRLPRPPLSAAGRRRSWAARLRHRRWPPNPGVPRHTPSPSQPGRTAACAAGGAATPQRGGHRRAVGCRAAGEASGHPDRRRPSQAPRRVS